MTENETIGLGLIGCGAFGEFCLHAYNRLPEVRIAAVADANFDAARRLAKQFDCPAYRSMDDLSGDPGVDLVHVATPPSSHHELVMTALRNGRHVLCEKPLAMTLEQADEMLAAAREEDLICPVNFVLRYNAVTDAVHRVLRTGALGKVLAGRLTNCAKDTPLPPNHWFWDKTICGGIFIEHGVHFYDMYSYWCGPGRVIAAHAETREGTQQEDRVLSVVRHDAGALVSHYHGFDQIIPMDRADHRLVCEMGDIAVYGWIPLSLLLDVAVDDEGADCLREALPEATIETLQTFPGTSGHLRGRGVMRNVTKRLLFTWTPKENKEEVYSDSLRALLSDQIAYIRNPALPRRITEQAGYEALALAVAAAEMATRAALE